jgi:hypothetical protein
MITNEEEQLLDEEKSLGGAVIELKSRYVFVIVGLGAGAIMLGTCGYILAGSVGASLLGGVGGAIGGLAGATEQKTKTSSH